MNYSSKTEDDAAKYAAELADHASGRVYGTDGIVDYGPSEQWKVLSKRYEDPRFYDDLGDGGIFALGAAVDNPAEVERLFAAAVAVLLLLATRVAPSPQAAKAERHRVMASEASPQPLPPLVSRLRAEDAGRQWGFSS